MAKDHEKIEDDMERNEEHLSGIRTLSEEARDARNAGRKLENEDSGVYGAVIQMQKAVEEYKASNRSVVEQMQAMVCQMRDVLDEVERIKADAQDTSHSAQQAALMGVNKAQENAEKITLRRINDVTEKNKKYIDQMVQESRRRIERLMMITLPDRLFYTGKWVVLILALFILSHVAWRMVGA